MTVTCVAASALLYTCCDAEPPGRVILIGGCIGVKLCFVVPTVRGLSVGGGDGQGRTIPPAKIGLHGVGGGHGTPAAFGGHGVGGGHGTPAGVGLHGVGAGVGLAAYDELMQDRTSSNKATSMKRTRYITDSSLKSKHMPRRTLDP